MIRLGLCGAHRVGKTTLARAFSEKAGIKFLPTSVSGIATNLGLDVSKPIEPKERNLLQTEIFEDFSNQFRTKGSWVTDRTPFDALAYSYLEYPDTAIEYQKFLQSALSQLCHFTHLVYIPPAIRFQSAEGKQDAGLHTQSKLDFLLSGLLSRYLELSTFRIGQPLLFRMSPSSVDLEDRLTELQEFTQLYWS